MTNFKPIGLGDRVKDPITGFTGIVVAMTTWLHGCIRCAVKPEALKDGLTQDEQHFDQAALHLVEAGVHEAHVLGVIPAPESPQHRSTGGPGRESAGFRR